MSDDVLHFELSGGVSVLTFCPHCGQDTATFDIATSKRDRVGEYTIAPDYRRLGTGICTNIDRAAARELRDALDAWLRGLS